LGHAKVQAVPGASDQGGEVAAACRATTAATLRALGDPLTEFKALGLQSRIPAVSVQMGDHVAILLRWEPELVAGLRDRGAKVYDLPAALDPYLATIDSQPDSAVAQTCRQVRLLYLDPAGDRAREALFLRRLARGRGVSRGGALR
jgi:hypothetical protein